MTKRILVVEDQEDLRGVLRVLLTGSGYDMIEAADGQAGVEKARADLPDLILMDIQLPVIDGYGATRQIKADPKVAATPIIAVSSFAMKGDEEKARAARCNHYVTKPYSPVQLLRIIRGFVLTDRINRGQVAAARSLVRTIFFELLLVAIIFALVATWRFTPPPRSLAEAAAEPVVLSFHTAAAFANIAFTPGRAGSVTVSMIVMTGNLELLDAKAVTVTLANPTAGVEPIVRPAYKPGDGSWRIDVFTVPLPGLWSARVDVVMPDSTIVTLDDQVEFRP
jgi:CheY-like chemotaxis protein